MYLVENTVPSLVLDIGTHTAKGGVGGEDLPRSLVPSHLGWRRQPEGTAESSNRVLYVGCQELFYRRDGLEVGSPFESNGMVQDWEMLESLVDHMLRKELAVDPREQGVLFSEPTYYSRSEREKLVELMFEKSQTAALYLEKSPVLAAYANGRTTGLVVDVSASGTSVVPVFEGHVVKNRHLRTSIGGTSLTNKVMEIIQRKEIRLRPIYSIKKVPRIAFTPAASPQPSNEEEAEDEFPPAARVEYDIVDVDWPNTTTSYGEYCKFSLAEEVKEALCRVNDASQDLSGIEVPMASYELPDGNTVDLGAEKFEAAEILFGKLPHCAANPAMDTRSENGGQSVVQGASDGLSGLVADTVSRCESSMHRDLLNGICLTGGSSVVPGLFERLYTELSFRFGKPPRVIAATGIPERRFCAWTGGSILATFSEFQKMWFSKDEYEENGASFVHKKCP